MQVGALLLDAWNAGLAGDIQVVLFGNGVLDGDFPRAPNNNAQLVRVGRRGFDVQQRRLRKHDQPRGRQKLEFGEPQGDSTRKTKEG